MPTKRNRAGQQQNYVEAGHGDASGEYGDNATGSNKHIQFAEFKKPKGNIEVEIKANGETNPPKAQLKYDGKGNEHLSSELGKKFTGAKGKITPNGKSLLEEIKGADDELSGIIGDYYKTNPNVQIKLGKNLSSYYQHSLWSSNWKVQLGADAYEGTDKCYSKGGIFFHESGHALDYTFKGSHYDDTWSNNYISEKHNKSISDMIKEEITANVDYEQVKKDYEALKESYKTPEYDGWVKEKDQLQSELETISKEVYGNPDLKAKTDELAQLRKQKVDAWRSGNYDDMKKYQSEIDAKNVEWAEFEKSLYPSDYKEKLERKRELSKQITGAVEKAYSDANVKYGDLSDMMQASLGNSKRISMGHASSYFDARSRGKEAFAEIMSAKATNPQSLEVMQKYIPKTLEIFDEIIDKIKKGGNE